MTARWVQQVLKEMNASGEVTYLDAAQCKNVGIGDSDIDVAMMYSPRANAVLVAYVNPTNTDRLLNGQARAALFSKLKAGHYSYVVDPVSGKAHYTVVDLPAQSGKLELIYADSVDFWGVRRGPLPTGGMLHYLRQAAVAN